MSINSASREPIYPTRSRSGADAPRMKPVSSEQVREMDAIIAIKVEAYKVLAKEVTTAHKFLAKKESQLLDVYTKIAEQKELMRILQTQDPRGIKEYKRIQTKQKKAELKTEKLAAQVEGLENECKGISKEIVKLNLMWQQSENALVSMHNSVKEVSPTELKSLPALKEINEKIVNSFDRFKAFGPLAEIKKLSQQVRAAQEVLIYGTEPLKDHARKQLTALLGRLYMFTRIQQTPEVVQEAQAVIKTIDKRAIFSSKSAEEIIINCKRILQNFPAEISSTAKRETLSILFADIEQAHAKVNEDKSFSKDILKQIHKKLDTFQQQILVRYDA